MRRLALTAALALVSLGMCACTDHLVRRDSLGYGAGNAVSANIATHLIDPWPRYAGDTDTTTSGDRLARAVERYRTSTTAGGAPAAPSQGATAATTAGTPASGPIR